MLRALCGALVALCTLSVAACQTGGSLESSEVDAANIDPAAAVGSRDAAPAGGQHFIEFRSRHAQSYGHSFVIFGRLDANGEMIDPEVAGLHPATDSAVPYLLGHVVPVPSETGASDGDLDDRYMSASWRVPVSPSEYAETVSYIRDLQASSPTWHAAFYNCNTFVADIARSMGYRTPFIWLPPEQFINRLREMNTGQAFNDSDTGMWQGPVAA